MHQFLSQETHKNFSARDMQLGFISSPNPHIFDCSIAYELFDLDMHMHGGLLTVKFAAHHGDGQGREQLLHQLLRLLRLVCPGLIIQQYWLLVHILGLDGRLDLEEEVAELLLVGGLAEHEDAFVDAVAEGAVDGGG